MKTKIKTIIIAKDGWPLERINGRPITNFIRRLLHASHKECWQCYENRRAIKVSDKPINQ